MKICLISKYPPIEGGVSSANYWLAKALGERGHKIFVVTNAWEVEDGYREKFNSEDLEYYQPKNVTVFNTDPGLNHKHIPYSKSYTEKITNLAMEVVENYDCEVIDSKYIIPYGIAGYFTSHFTGVPQILRHAGSDICRFSYSPYLNKIFKKVIKSANKIATFPDMKNRIESLGANPQKIYLLDDYYVNTEHYRPKKSLNLKSYGIEKSCPVITFIGKPSIAKGILYLLRACEKIEEEFKLLLVIGKNGRDYDFIFNKIKELGIEDKVNIIDFVPPWRISDIMASSTAVVCPEYRFSVKEHGSIIPREAMACGSCPIISKDIYENYSWMNLEDGRDVILINPVDIRSFSMKLEDIIKNPGKAREIGEKARKKSEELEKFDSYISDFLDLYRSVL